MPVPPDPLGSNWLQSQDEHALACAKYGDCIYDEVQQGAADIEASWSMIGKKWYRLVDKAIAGPLFGLMSGPVSKEWFLYVFNRPERMWPAGLTPNQKKILRLASVVSLYFDPADHGIQSTPPQGEVADDETTLRAFVRFAALFEAQIGIPMWKSYLEISKSYAAQISPLCESTYGEACSQTEAENIFKGDLQRGWKLDTLNWGSVTRRVFPRFMDWVSL